MTAWALNNLLLGAAASTVLVVLGLCLRGAAGHGAVLRYRVMLWFLVALMVVVPAQMVAGVLAPDWARRTIEPLGFVTGQSQIDVVYGRLAPAQTTTATGGAEAGARPGAGMRAWLLPGALGVYLAGAGAGLALLSVRLLSAIRLVRGAAPVEDRAVLEEWSAIVGEGGARAVRVMESPSVTVPSAWGLWRPAVILPADLGELEGPALRCALRHELTHLHRGDGLTTLALHVALVLFWFNPLVHLFARRLEEDRESSCDAEVIRFTGARHYALALLGCCRAAGRARPALLATFWSHTNLERRLHMLEHALDRVSARRARLIAGATGVCLVAVLVGSAGVAMAVSPKRPGAVQPADQPARPDGIQLKSTRESGGKILEVEVRPVVAVRNRRLLLDSIMREARGSAPDSVTEQETVASYRESQAAGAGARVEARELILNLPEGSPLRAVFEGESIKADMTGANATITVEAGVVRLVDDGGVARVTVRPSTKNATVVWTAKRSNDEVSFTISSLDGKEPNAVVELDLEKGIPRGEKQPPHGAVRWAKQAGDAAEKRPVRVKIQWVLDIEKLKQETGGARSEFPAVPGAGQRTYTVRVGDTLASIAEREYGSAAGAELIFDANRNKMKDRNDLKVSMVLTLPGTGAR